MNLKLWLQFCGAICAFALPAASPAASAQLTNTFGTYNAAPRTPAGRVAHNLLLQQLLDVHANTYNWLVWHADSDWEDLKIFLPRANASSLRVWVTLVPPSESPPRTKRYSEPFRLDYEKWAVEIARLSLAEPNLVAWSLDDFSHNSKDLSPDRLRTILAKAREVNPGLAFVPCIYYRHVTEAYAAKYRGLFDGVLFPYRNESGEMNLKDTAAVAPEVARLKQLLGPGVPVFVDVYATRHSRLQNSTPEYVGRVMAAGRQAADGVLIYCHQTEAQSPEKYRVIKSLFGEWSRSAAPPPPGKAK